ncbi:MAG: hypothetical protein FH762_19930 [Firmicutes bacterium]|nr:hypothetical protein [Bacillota bacterium]
MNDKCNCKLILKHDELYETLDTVFKNEFKVVYSSGDLILNYLRNHYIVSDTKKIFFVGHSYTSKTKDKINYINRKKNITTRVNSQAVHNLLLSENQFLLISSGSKKETAGFISGNIDEIEKARSYFNNLWDNGYSLYFGER